MVYIRPLKIRFTSTLFTLFIALQISACSTEETTATSAAISSDLDAGVNLAWIAPSEREDTSPLSLSEISGYKIYYGPTQGQYPNIITIEDGSAEGFSVTSLPTGTYYLVVTTLDTDGRESKYSTEIKIET